MSLTARLLVGALAVSAAAFKPAIDPRLWLEEVEGKAALEWARARNAESLGELEADPRFAPLKAELRAILNAKDKIPRPAWRGGFVYNFWQDAEHVRGLWRRATLAEYRKAEPKWTTLLDVDRLGREEGESWVYQGARCAAPKQRRCLVELSRGGKDASESREFDVELATWAAGGFRIPEAKHEVAWLGEDELLVGSDYGPGTLTQSGYPRVIKRWKRGAPLAAAPKVFEGAESDVMVSPSVWETPEGRLPLVVVAKTFFESEYHRLQPDGTFRRLALPLDAQVQDWDGKRLLLMPQKDWTVAGRVFKAGSLVAAPDDAYDEAALAGKVELVYEPDERSSFESASAHRGSVYIAARENVVTKLYRARREGGRWTRERLGPEGDDSVGVEGYDLWSPELFLSVEGFMLPETIFLAEKPGAKLEPLKSLPPRFDAKGLEAKQYEAVSKDGTRVPYFLVRRADAPRDGSTPTVLWGYGGFQAVYGPYYPQVPGKAWLEKGGAYVVANIRGGGEFGPRWHQAALKTNRPRAFEDFEAVAEDLIKRGFTSSRRLGIMGGSNGGLLVGAAMTRRPELFRAVVCQVPLLDMLRYHKLLAGHSWMGEYGDPDGAEREAIRAYSPYHNVRNNQAYPKAFLLTSTKDDRVHPGHARKMVQLLREMDAKPLYYENIEGGHGAAADLEQRARRSALEWTFFKRLLVD